MAGQVWHFGSFCFSSSVFFFSSFSLDVCLWVLFSFSFSSLFLLLCRALYFYSFPQLLVRCCRRRLRRCRLFACFFRLSWSLVWLAASLSNLNTILHFYISFFSFSASPCILNVTSLLCRTDCLLLSFSFLRRTTNLCVLLQSHTFEFRRFHFSHMFSMLRLFHSPPHCSIA